jgi:hypothetical protein
MKLLIGGLAIILVILIFCIGNYFYMRKSLDEIITELDSLEDDVNRVQWQAAYEKSSSIIDRWTKKEKYYMAVLWHQHIDDAAIALHQLKSYIEQEDGEQAKNSIIEARTILQDIIEMESFSLGNIL